MNPSDPKSSTQNENILDVDQIEQLEQEEQQRVNTGDWTSGIDVVQIGDTIIDVAGDLLDGIDISF